MSFTDGKIRFIEIRLNKICKLKDFRYNFNKPYYQIMRILKDLAELVQANVISTETADQISQYYHQKTQKSSPKLILIFGILGALLVGTGILLILAHNWDALSKTSKTFLAFLLLIASQSLCLVVLLRKADNATWRECSGAFLSLALGSCISLISQIYHISGDFRQFVFVWSLLTLPIIYIMRSSATALLYIIGITAYLIDYAVQPEQITKALVYLGFLVAIIPYYLHNIKNNQDAVILTLLHWFIPLSILFLPVTLARSHGEFVFIIYFSLFAAYLTIGQSDYFKYKIPIQNGYNYLGSIGTIILLWTLSFDGFWNTILHKEISWNALLTIPEFIFAVIFSLITLGLQLYPFHSGFNRKYHPIQFVYLLVIPLFIIGYFHPVSVLFINLICLVLGVLIIRSGLARKNLPELNSGLFIIAGLIICRFFDSDLSFVFKGVLFVCIGIGFFLINYRMLKLKKSNEI